MIRKTIALGLIVGSFVFAGLILLDKKTPNFADSALETTKQFSTEEIPLPKTGNNRENTTQAAAKNVAEELAKLDVQNLKQLKPEKIVDEILSKQLSALDLSELDPQINPADLKIIKSSDKKVAENYLQNFRAILVNNFSKLDVDLSKPTAEDFKLLSSAYKRAIGEFYNLFAPESLSLIHREEIRLLMIQKNIFENLAQYNDDPLKAIVSVRFLEETNKQLAELKKIINAKVF